MDDLDRIFHRLVSNIRHRHSEYHTLPFTVQELYETLIPYRHHRRELGIETNQDYEIAMSRLLSGERDYLLADQSMRDKLKAELQSGHGDPGAFREFANAKVSLAPEALRRIRALTASGTEDGAPAEAAAPAAPAQSVKSPPAVNATFPVSSAAPASVTSPPVEASKAAPAALSSMMNASVPEGCRFCGGTLPEGRQVVYCPHCGNNLSVSRCPACGSELEKGWKFCVTCGRTVG
ncbi:MAG TPA: zinc ribbon domain-containing protein [Gemmatimonadaceae bacterium]|nr:zinc ribbon domain-containing protein [Gemmatimonadaceae bacterium]